MNTNDILAKLQAMAAEHEELATQDPALTFGAYHEGVAAGLNLAWKLINDGEDG